MIYSIFQNWWLSKCDKCSANLIGISTKLLSHSCYFFVWSGVNVCQSCRAWKFLNDAKWMVTDRYSQKSASIQPRTTLQILATIHLQHWQFLCNGCRCACKTCPAVRKPRNTHTVQICQKTVHNVSEKSWKWESGPRLQKLSSLRKVQHFAKWRSCHTNRATQSCGELWNLWNFTVKDKLRAPE